MSLTSFVAWFQQHSILLMLFFFVVIAWWAYAPKRKSKLQALGAIPLHDDH